MIRKIIALILFSALVLLSSFGIFSCRSLKKTSAKADSTVTRSEQSSLVWESETVTEINLTPGELLPYLHGDSLDLLPGVFVKPIEQSKSWFAKLGLTGKKSKMSKKSGSKPVETPLISAPSRVIFKKTERQSGHVEQKKNEDKQVKTSETTKTKESNASRTIAICLAVFSALLVIIILYLSKKRD